MGLSLYNTLARCKEPFRPLDSKRVGMYVCGPTVYDLAHIGNARPIIVFDILYRLLVNIYGCENVIYVRNITDVDDKINEAARLAGVSIEQITTQTTQSFHQDISELNALNPNVEPRATAHIPEMIEIIQQLIDRGHAYEVDNHVIFSVKSYQNYGKLSGKNIDDLISGARVDVASYKNHSADFVLWKPSEKSSPGWQSPWGRGRPGWHIECSAMSRKHIGDTIDIHGGGLDLIFPHHENEIAQSECACPKSEFVRYWVHNGYLTVNGEKMSKSTGNFVTIRQALDIVPGEVIRLFMLSAHYRGPIDWTEGLLQQAKTNTDRLYNTLRLCEDIQVDNSSKKPSKGVISSLEDDLNTPEALAELYGLASKLNKAKTLVERVEAKSSLLASGQLMGFFKNNTEAWFHGKNTDDGFSDSMILSMIKKRTNARINKDYAEADRIRENLEENGIFLEDNSNGTSWRRNN